MKKIHILSEDVCCTTHSFTNSHPFTSYTPFSDDRQVSASRIIFFTKSGLQRMRNITTLRPSSLLQAIMMAVSLRSSARHPPDAIDVKTMSKEKKVCGHHRGRFGASVRRRLRNRFIDTGIMRSATKIVSAAFCSWSPSSALYNTS